MASRVGWSTFSQSLSPRPVRALALPWERASVTYWATFSMGGFVSAATGVGAGASGNF